MPKALVDQYTEEELRNIVAASFSMSQVLRTLGYSVVTGNNNITVKKRLSQYQIDTSHFAKQKLVLRTEDNVFCFESTASQASLRRWYERLYPQEFCAICYQKNEWCGQKLILTLDHINGENKDNRLENLRWICPNCDRQLKTYAGRNIHK